MSNPNIANLVIQLNYKQHQEHLEWLKTLNASQRRGAKKIEPITITTFNHVITPTSDLNTINTNCLHRITKYIGISESERKKENCIIVEIINSREIKGY